MMFTFGGGGGISLFLQAVCLSFVPFNMHVSPGNAEPLANSYIIGLLLD